MRKEKDNTRRIGGLLLDAIMLSFFISFSLVDARIPAPCSHSAHEVSSPHDDLIPLHEFDALCGRFAEQVSTAQPTHIQSLDSLLRTPLIMIVGLVVTNSAQHLYNIVYTNTTINAP